MTPALYAVNKHALALSMLLLHEINNSFKILAYNLIRLILQFKAKVLRSVFKLVLKLDCSVDVSVYFKSVEKFLLIS